MLLLANLAVLAGFEWIDVPAPAKGRTRLAPLLLATETAAAPAPKEEPVVPEPAAHAHPSAQCVSVGPFEDEASAKRGAELLRKKGLASRERSEAGRGAQGFWVHVGGITSDALATVDLQKLADAGITDASVLQPGKDERRISAGLFTSRDQATHRLQELRRLGMKGEIAARLLPQTLFWVDVAVKLEDGTLPAQDLYKGPSTRIGALPCPAGSTLPETVAWATPPVELRIRNAMSARSL
jgi:hypothetical protein